MKLVNLYVLSGANRQVRITTHTTKIRVKRAVATWQALDPSSIVDQRHSGDKGILPVSKKRELNCKPSTGVAQDDDLVSWMDLDSSKKSLFGSKVANLRTMYRCKFSLAAVYGKVVVIGDSSEFTDKDTDKSGKVNLDEASNKEFILNILNW